jgi:hypothetical protein
MRATYWKRVYHSISLPVQSNYSNNLLFHAQEKLTEGNLYSDIFLLMHDNRRLITRGCITIIQHIQ